MPHQWASLTKPNPNTNTVGLLCRNKVVPMFQKYVDSVSVLARRGAMTLVGRSMPCSVLIACRAVSRLPSVPRISLTCNGRGHRYYRMRYGRGRRNRTSLYLGYLDEQSRQLLIDHINRRWPDQEIRWLTGLRKELRRKAVELAVSTGFGFRGHEIRRMSV